MGRKIIIHDEEPERSIPALTPEARENELIALAYDTAEQQLRAGTASSQVITHFLKLQNEREKRDLEREKLVNENKLLRAKADAYEAQKEKNSMYAAAIRAMGIYSGTLDEDDVSNMEKEEALDFYESNL